MSHYKPYPAYKDSGVEWIGRVPEHWVVLPVKFRYDVRLGKMLQPAANSDADALVPYHRAQTVQWERIDNSVVESMWASPADIEKFAIAPGDLLICEGGDVCRAAVVGDLPAPHLIFQNSLHRVRPNGQHGVKWVLRLMQHLRSSGWIDVLCNKNTIVHFTSDKLGALACPLPPLSEQTTIAAALDSETARIDALIAKKTRFIELLKEKRQALITHAVTKGLDPNVKMKDSGVEWIGAVPEHWGLMKFGRVARVTEGLVDPRIERYRAMPLFAPNHIESGTGRLLAVESAAEQDAESGKYLCKAGCVVYSKIRPALAKVIIAPTDGLCSADMYPLTCTDKAQTQWLFYLMLSQPFTAWAVLESDRVAMPKINRESLSDLVVAVPPVAEQQKIAIAIEAQLPRVDAVVAKVNTSIALLKERRSALITAAVTGQIDLREAE